MPASFFGMEALTVIEKNLLDLIILDVQLPDKDGFQLMPMINKYQIPVIFLTARSEISDRVKGLNLGGEDYLVKPFAIAELLARVEVVLRRFQGPKERFTLDQLEVLLEERRVYLQGGLIELTPQEFALLETFIQYKNIALTREQLLQQAWGMDYDGDERTVDVHVQRLRKKLALNQRLVTVFKLGYRLEVS